VAFTLPLNKRDFVKNIYDDIGIVAKRNYREICRLTDPLKQFFGIDLFWRNAHGNDGSYSVLGNYPPLAEVFFGENLYLGHPYFRHPRFFRSGFALPDLLQYRDFEETQGKLRGRGCFHIMIYMHKHEKGVIEYGFASSQFRPGFEATYLNHQQAILKFITAFEMRADHWIQKSDEYKMNMAEIIGKQYHEKPKLSEKILVPDADLHFLSAIEGDPEKKLGILSLTHAEKVCLGQYLNGHTTKEIAQKQFRSPRTIEGHIERAKSKLGIHSRSELFEVLIPYRDFF
jgi:DNA-binding CsgD family transcriptional regulator